MITNIYHYFVIFQKFRTCRLESIINAVFIYLFLLSSVLSAGQGQRLIIPKISQRIILDGKIDEAVWKTIEPLPVVMHLPNFGGDPSERTKILLAHDENYLYVAGRLYDREPSKILSTSKKRDATGFNRDWFGILIDSFNDKENILAFFTEPSGLRLDFTIFNDAEGSSPWSSSWNTFWDVATSRNDEGWFVEMRIPFSSLRFQSKGGQAVMGMIIWRWIARKNEVILFPAIPPNWGFWSRFKPSQAQEVVFTGVHRKKPVYLTPYTLGGIGQSFELNSTETSYLRDDDFSRNIGLDIKYGLTSNLTLDVTMNTDFAQVEADNQEVNLTRFSLFFPEKRLFFQERSSVFDFRFDGSNRLFYSRRIGIYDENTVPIYGGGRLVGRFSKWDMGFLSMQTAPVEDLSSENFTVLRLRHQVLDPNYPSYLGGIITNRLGMDGTYNTAYGLDGIFRLFGNDYLTLQWAQTFENGYKNNPASLESARMRINWERRIFKGLSYNIGYSRAGANYHPGIGYERHENYYRIGNRLAYGWIPGQKSALVRHGVYLDGFMYTQNEDRSTESGEADLGWWFKTKSGYYGEFAVQQFYENVTDSFSLSDQADVPVGKYTFYGFKSAFNTSPGNPIYLEFTLNTGSFYDGLWLSSGVEPRWNLSTDIELSTRYQFNRVIFSDRDQQFTSHILRFHVLTMLSIKFSVIAFIQYNSAANVIISNIRFRYNPREGNDLYLVYDEGFNTDRHREYPNLPITKNRTILMKYTYTFRL